MTQSPSRRGSGGQVAAGTALANVLAYGLSVVLSRRLGPEGFGEVAPLLAVMLIASVPGQALQAGVARRGAALRGPDPAAAQLLVRAAGVGAGVVLVGLVAMPALRALLDLPGWSALVWTSLALLPHTVCFACLGLLQGAERFGRLSAALVVVQGARLAGGAAGVLLGGTPSAAMAGTAAGLVVAAVLCIVLSDTRRSAASPPVADLLRGLTRDTASVLAVLVLTNLDVLLARTTLTAVEAGLYAAGALVAKIAFFAPSFVVVVLYPSLSRLQERRRALRQGLLALSAAAALSVVGAAVAAPLLPAVLGEDYAALQESAWLFAAAGSALAVVFLLVQAGIAVQDHRMAAAAWSTAAVEVVLVVTLVDTLRLLILVVLLGALLLVAAGLLLERRSPPKAPLSAPLPVT